jgi:hypothetical protein
MIQAELNEVLDNHQAWLAGRIRGKKADWRGADLRGADLHNADLRNADLNGANLSYANLHNADLRNADLNGANLSYANLIGANLSYANLIGADLISADLRDTNLRGADLDYSTWPLWCGSLSVKIDKRLAAQLLYHACRAMQSCADDPDVAAVLASDAVRHLANQFRRVREGGCREIKPPEKGGAQ